MGNLVQHSDAHLWVETGEMSDSVTIIPDEPRDLDSEPREKTDRPLRFPSRRHPPAQDSARERWLEEHDIQTEFLDAGIGCCWIAQQGDREPVTGETEEEAIARLVQDPRLPSRAA